ncbi:MAG TPA: hypothetical protein VEZ13_19645 [Brevibacillus sp.]|nr:hypothetical protein [Brevibacillus sp.]
MFETSAYIQVKQMRIELEDLQKRLAESQSIPLTLSLLSDFYKYGLLATIKVLTKAEEELAKQQQG